MAVEATEDLGLSCVLEVVNVVANLSVDSFCAYAMNVRPQFFFFELGGIPFSQLSGW